MEVSETCLDVREIFTGIGVMNTSVGYVCMYGGKKIYTDISDVSEC